MKTISFQKLAYSVAETETALGVSRTTIYRLIDSGKLKAIRLGRRRMILAADLERLLNMGATTLEIGTQLPGSPSLGIGNNVGGH